MLIARGWLPFTVLAMSFMSAQASPMQQPQSAGNCGVVPGVPAVPQDAKVFFNTAAVDGTGAAPDLTGAIQDTLDHLKTGDWLVFEPGVYRVSKALSVATDGVTLYGRGATIFSNSATDGGITVRADNVAIYGFTLDQASVARQSTPWSGGIAIYDETNHIPRRVRGSIIQRNVIKNAAAGGIFIYSAENFTVAENSVSRSLADGIHVTEGSANGRIIANKVSETGDDMIAVVSYAGSAAEHAAAERYKDWNKQLRNLNRNIYIAGNHVDNQYWGRGISVVGGTQITIEKNFVSRTPFAAGIYLVRETSYRSFGLHNVLVRANNVSDIQTMSPTFERGDNSHRLTGHGAIEISSLQDDDEMNDARFREAFSVSDVAIVDNVIRHSRFAGIRGGIGAANTVSRVLVRGNTQSDVGAGSVVEMHQGLNIGSVRCSDNKLNGTVWASRCTSDVAPVNDTIAVSGAMLKCSKGGILVDASPPL